MHKIKTDKGYLKLNTSTDYNQNTYFVGFSKECETVFSTQYSARVTAFQCGLKKDEFTIE